MSYQTQWDGRSGYGGKRRRPALGILLVVIGLLAVLFGSLELLITAKSGGRSPEGQSDPKIMVVFGCQVMPGGPSILLRDRLDTALDYLAGHPDMTVVVTGGKGDDEHMSEAQCMYNYLRDHGFDGTILMEDRSETTWENILYSSEVLRENGYDTTDDILAVSSGFHLARIEMLFTRAMGQKYSLYTLAAPVSHRPSAVKMFFREPLAFVKSFVTDR